MMSFPKNIYPNVNRSLSEILDVFVNEGFDRSNNDNYSINVSSVNECGFIRK